MRKLIAKLYLDNHETFLANYVRLNDFHNEHCTAMSTTGKPDCWFLYLLALHFKPKCVFEAGTYIGSTAKFLADACMEHGGVVHTCDPRNKFKPSERHKDHIIFHNKTATEVLKEFEEDGKKIDLAFYDADFMGIDHIFDLVGLASDDFVFATHDYTDVDGQPSKGKHNIDAAWSVLKDKGYQFFFPEFFSYKMGHVETPLPDGFSMVPYGINGCTAVLLPPSFKV